MKLSNKVYDVLVFIAQIVLPALAVLYAGLAKVWGLPFSDQIPTTIMLVDAFLGAVLKISNVNYKKNLES